MKRIGRFITATALFALFAASPFTGAQKPPQHQQGQQQRHQTTQQQRSAQRPAQRQQGSVQRQHSRQMQRTPQQRQEQRVLQRNIWREHRATRWDHEHRTWQQRGGYNGYRIPDAYYRYHYGPHHWFRMYNLPFMLVTGYPRFQYGGYWFLLMDPYPEYWGPYWYQTDDCYIVWIDGGYYLFNRMYPGRPGIAISVMF